MKVLASYTNGNYNVTLYDDGTKIKENCLDFFRADFPDSIDIKITDYCDNNCPYCHENSSAKGKHGRLDAEFFGTLPKGIELALGGGNPLSHPDIIPFLEKLKANGQICNLTVNENHFIKSRNLITRLINEHLIYGLGISVTEANAEIIKFAKEYSNTVFHVINGIFNDYESLAGNNLKLLILGYKHKGRGEKYYDSSVEKNMEHTKKILSGMLSRFDVLSFDNLALSQLDVKRLIGEEKYKSIFMGDDGDASMYIDLVKNEYAVSSTSQKRFPLKSSIYDMFKKW